MSSPAQNQSNQNRVFCFSCKTELTEVEIDNNGVCLACLFQEDQAEPETHDDPYDDLIFDWKDDFDYKLDLMKALWFGLAVVSALIVVFSIIFLCVSAT